MCSVRTAVRFSICMYKVVWIACANVCERICLWVCSETRWIFAFYSASSTCALIAAAFVAVMEKIIFVFPVHRVEFVSIHSKKIKNKTNVDLVYGIVENTLFTWNIVKSIILNDKESWRYRTQIIWNYSIINEQNFTMDFQTEKRWNAKPSLRLQ